jgi:hypothetical protein
MLVKITTHTHTHLLYMTTKENITVPNKLHFFKINATKLYSDSILKSYELILLVHSEKRLLRIMKSTNSEHSLVNARYEV